MYLESLVSLRKFDAQCKNIFPLEVFNVLDTSLALTGYSEMTDDRMIKKTILTYCCYELTLETLMLRWVGVGPVNAVWHTTHICEHCRGQYILLINLSEEKGQY